MVQNKVTQENRFAFTDENIEKQNMLTNVGKPKTFCLFC